MADGAAVEQGRWDWDPFANNWHPTPEVEIQVYRAEPGALAGELAPLRFDDLRGEHPLRVLGRRERDGAFVLSTRDRGGGKNGRRKGFTTHGGRVVLTDFGPPKIPSRYAEPASQPPQAPTRTEGRPPPMPHEPFVPVPQTMFEAPSNRQGDPLVAQLLGHVLTLATQGQSQQSSELRELVRKLEDQRTQAATGEGIAQALTRTEARLTRLETGQAQLLELVTKLAQAFDGTPIQTVEQVRSLTQRLGPEAFGLSANPTPAAGPGGFQEFMAWLLEMAEPFMPMFQTMFQQWLVNKAAGAVAPPSAPAAAPRPGPRPFGHGRVQRPVNGHASAPEPDAGA